MTVFCDFDGPIIDVSRRYYRTYGLALARTRSLMPPELRGRVASLSLSRFWQMKQEHLPDFEIALRSGIPEAQFPLFIDHVHRLVNQQSLLRLDRVQPGARWGLTMLRDQGLKLVIVTLRRSVEVREILAREQLESCVTDVFGADDEHAAYLNLSAIKEVLLQRAIAQMEQQGSRPLCMVGDTEADVLAAQSNGIPAVAVTCGIRSRRYLELLNPDRICTDLLCFTHSLLQVPVTQS